MENSERDVQNVLQKFNKVEIIENFLEKSGNKQHAKIKKKDIIKQAINILTVKFSDLGELILFLRLKYLEIEKEKERFWKVYKIEDSKKFSKEVLQPDNVKNTLVHYFKKYDLPCNTAYAINKGSCIWVALDFRGASAPKVVYLIAHKLLSVVFLSVMKPYPEIEKIIRRTFRGSGITQLKSIVQNAHRISNLNLEKFQILQGNDIVKNRIQENENTLLVQNKVSKKTDIPRVENGLPEKAGTSSAKRSSRRNKMSKKTDISPLENMIPIKTGIPPFKRKSLKLNKISEKREVVVVQNGISEKTGVSPVKKRALGINSMSEKAGMLSVKSRRPIRTTSVKGRALKYQKHSISENIEESSSKSTIPEKLEISPSENKISHERVISSLKRKDSGENKISEKREVFTMQNRIHKKTRLSPIKEKTLDINSMSEKIEIPSMESRTPVRTRLSSIKRKAIKVNRISENAEVSSMESRIPEKTKVSLVKQKALGKNKTKKTVSTVQRKLSEEMVASAIKYGELERKKVLPVQKMSEIKSSTQGKEETSQAKNKRNWKKSNISAPQLDCIDEIAEENIESFERGKKSQENLENENLPKIECLKYTIRSSPFYEKKKDKAKHTVCSVTFYGTDVLQGIIKLTECGVADKPLPDYLYKEPRTGNNEFKLTFRDDK